MATVATQYDTPFTDHQLPPRWSDALARTSAFLARPAVAYPLLALVQLRVLWGDWLHRDLENGDNLVYVQGALRWAELGAVDLVWSPLYSMYYGAVIAIVGDAADATWFQRALMTWSVTLLVLAVLRLLLPASIAWLVAAWWATLESAHDVAVEVHLFAMVPFLAAAVLAPRGRLGRTLALGVLLASALLIRNEYAVAAALFGAACVWWEVRRRRMAGLLPYAGAVVAVGLLVVWMDGRANEPIAKLLQPESNLSWKHTANFCQAYAAAYVQRHDDWSGDVFLGCNTLMERDFGVTAPTLRQSPTYGQAFLANPLAILEHVAWTLSLTGNGLQIALFGAMSGTVSPEFSFIGVKRDELLVPILSALLVGVTGVGAVLAFLRVRAYPHEALNPMQNILWPLVVLLCGVATSLFVIAAVRPRPEYIYPLTLFVMVLAGGSLALIAARLPRWLTASLLTPFDTPTFMTEGIAKRLYQIGCVV